MAKTKLIRKDWPKVRRFTKKGNTYYEVDCRAVHWTGQQKFSFKEKNHALERAKEIGDAVKKHGFDALNNISGQLTNQRLNQLSDTLSQHGKTIDDAGKFYIAHLEAEKAKENSLLISELCQLWYDDKLKKKSLRKPTLTAIRSHRNLFSRDFSTDRILTISRQNIDIVVGSLKKADGSLASDQTRRNYLSYLRQFFNWCIKNEYTDKNPANNVDVTVVSKQPDFLTLDQCQHLLKLVQTDPHCSLVGYISLCLFAGLRPTEAQQLTWKDIELEYNSIVIDPRITKVKKGRRVDISSNLKSWLQSLKQSDDLIPADFRRKNKSFRKAYAETIIKLSPDVLRHTYATFWLSKYSDRNKLSELMGNSPSVIGKHYLRHPNQTDTEKFWKLSPVDPKVEEFFEIK